MRAILLVVLAAGCGRFGFGDDAGAPNDSDPLPSVGLVAHFSMDDDPADGDLDDDIGDLRAICGIGTTCGTQVPGKVGMAVSFAGAQFYRVPFDPKLLPPNAFTVGVWVNPRAFQKMVFATKRYGTVWNTWGLTIDDAAIPYFETTHDNGGTPDGDGLASTGALPMNTWSHYAISWDGAQRRIYLNGFRVANDTPSPIIFDAGEVMIGCDEDDGAGQFGFVDGAIDDLRIYDRALSDADLATIGIP